MSLFYWSLIVLYFSIGVTYTSYINRRMSIEDACYTKLYGPSKYDNLARGIALLIIVVLWVLVLLIRHGSLQANKRLNHRKY